MLQAEKGTGKKKPPKAIKKPKKRAKLHLRKKTKHNCIIRHKRKYPQNAFRNSPEKKKEGEKENWICERLERGEEDKQKKITEKQKKRKVHFHNRLLVFLSQILIFFFLIFAKICAFVSFFFFFSLKKKTFLFLFAFVRRPSSGPIFYRSLTVSWRGAGTLHCNATAAERYDRTIGSRTSLQQMK